MKNPKFQKKPLLRALGATSTTTALILTTLLLTGAKSIIVVDKDAQKLHPLAEEEGEVRINLTYNLTAEGSSIPGLTGDSKFYTFWSIAFLLNNREPFPVSLALDMNTTVIAAKLINGQPNSDWGISNCNEALGCITSEDRAFAVFNDSFPAVNASTRFQITETGPDSTKNLNLETAIFKEDLASAPYNKGFGTFGLAPLSPGLEFVREAFGSYSDKKYIKLEFFINRPANSTIEDLTKAEDGAFEGSYISFFDKYKDEEELPKYKLRTNDQNWGFKTAAFGPMDDNGKMFNDTNGDACIRPNDEFMFAIFNTQKVNYLKRYIFQRICGEDACTFQAAVNISKAPSLLFRHSYNTKIGYKYIQWEIPPEDYIYVKFPLLEVAVRDEISGSLKIFDEGQPCRNYEFALGRYFFMNNKLTMWVDETNNDGYYNITNWKGDAAKTKTGSSIFFVYGLVSLAVFVVIILLVWIFAIREKKGLKTINLHQGLDEEVGF